MKKKQAAKMYWFKYTAKKRFDYHERMGVLKKIKKTVKTGVDKVTTFVKGLL